MESWFKNLYSDGSSLWLGVCDEFYRAAFGGCLDGAAFDCRFGFFGEDAQEVCLGHGFLESTC